jgi:hypothetical protein
MTFADQITDDLGVFVNPDEFGSAAIYTPHVSDPALIEAVSCNVIINREQVIQPGGFDAGTIDTETTITALFSDVASPQSGSKFVTGGITYIVQKLIPTDDRAIVEMAVTESEWS